MKNRGTIILIPILAGILATAIWGCKKDGPGQEPETIPDFIYAGAQIPGTDYYDLDPDSAIMEYPHDTFPSSRDNHIAYQEQLLKLDVDHDAEPDLMFTVWWSVSPGGTGSIGSQVSPQENTFVAYDSVKIPVSGDYYERMAHHNEYLDKISDSLDWTVKTCYLDYLPIDGGNWDWDEKLDLWEGRENLYLGFRKDIPGFLPLYGWMKIDVLNFNDLRVSEFAITKKVPLEEQ